MSSFFLPGMLNQWATIIPVFKLKAYNGDNMKLMDCVVQCVLKKSKREHFNVVKYSIGLDEMLDNLENTVLLQQQSWKDQYVWIVGLGGIGKTTLVKEGMNQKLPESCGTCFSFAF